MVEQIPLKLLPDVIKNTNAKIVHRLVSRDDQALLTSTLGLEEQESLYLTSLQAGHAICAKEGMQRPVEIKVLQPDQSKRVSDEKVHREMIRREMAVDADDEAGAMAIRSALGGDGVILARQLLCSLAFCESSGAVAYTEKARARVTSLLLQRDQSNSESSIKKFLTTSVVELLAKGPLCLADGKVHGITPIVKRLLDGDERGRP